MMTRSFRAMLGQVRDQLFPRENCGHKRRYSEIGAQRTRAERMAKGSDPLFVYQCPHCGGWHLTRQEQVASADEFKDLDADV